MSDSTKGGASTDTTQINRDAVALYAMDDRRDFVDTQRGFLAPWPGKVLSSVDGHVIFDAAWFDFLADGDTPAPDTVTRACGGSRN